MLSTSEGSNKLARGRNFGGNFLKNRSALKDKISPLYE